jgi:hypothetical protein
MGPISFILRIEEMRSMAQEGAFFYLKKAIKKKHLQNHGNSDMATISLILRIKETRE